MKGAAVQKEMGFASQHTKAMHEAVTAGQWEDLGLKTSAKSSLFHRKFNQFSAL